MRNKAFILSVAICGSFSSCSVIPKAPEQRGALTYLQDAKAKAVEKHKRKNPDVSKWIDKLKQQANETAAGGLFGSLDLSAGTIPPNVSASVTKAVGAIPIKDATATPPKGAAPGVSKTVAGAAPAQNASVDWWTILIALFKEGYEYAMKIRAEQAVEFGNTIEGYKWEKP